MQEQRESDPSFAELGVSEALCRCIATLGWAKPTEIQAKVIPYALQGKDVVGLAETGSGKTGRFFHANHSLFVANRKSIICIFSDSNQRIGTTNY
jgi:superfamily II DNA/RNA helicase